MNALRRYGDYVGHHGPLSCGSCRRTTRGHRLAGRTSLDAPPVVRQPTATDPVLTRGLLRFAARPRTRSRPRVTLGPRPVKGHCERRRRRIACRPIASRSTTGSDRPHAWTSFLGHCSRRRKSFPGSWSWSRFRPDCAPLQSWSLLRFPRSRLMDLRGVLSNPPDALRRLINRV